MISHLITTTRTATTLDDDDGDLELLQISLIRRKMVKVIKARQFINEPDVDTKLGNEIIANETENEMDNPKMPYRLVPNISSHLSQNPK